MRWALLALLAVPAFAQLAPFNAAGVTMGHYHLMVPDVEAQKRIWVDVLGGELSGKPPLEFVKFPGVYLILSEGKGTQGTEGSALDSITFFARDLEAISRRLKDAHVFVIHEDGELLVTRFPGEIKVLFWKNPGLNVPLQHLAFEIAAIDSGAERAWWTRAFQAEIDVSDFWTQLSIPGSVFMVHEVPSRPEPTSGRSLDHMGVNVNSVDEYCTKLASLGITCEHPMGANTPIAMVTSPAGVRVEINQGLETR